LTREKRGVWDEGIAEILRARETEVESERREQVKMVYR
jgi:hypothetical protein